MREEKRGARNTHTLRISMVTLMAWRTWYKTADVTMRPGRGEGEEGRGERERGRERGRGRGDGERERGKERNKNNDICIMNEREVDNCV